MPTNLDEMYTCGYCGRVMSWSDMQEHNPSEDLKEYKAKYPNRKTAAWIDMIQDTMRNIDLTTNNTHIIYTNHYKSRQ